MNQEVIKKQVIDQFDRKKLTEGRNYGVGFSILDKLNDSEYKALMPFTACKDYLNDFIYIETTNKPLSIIYGFKHTYTGILKDKDYLYLGINTLHYNNSNNKYDKFDEVQNLVKNNGKNIVKFLNKVEEAFKQKDLTVFEDQIEDILILKVPIFWSKFSFLFSLYLLFIRVFIDITEEETKKDVYTLIKDKNTPLIVADNMLFKATQKLFLNLDLEALLDYKYPEGAQSGTIHNFGINSRLQQIPKYK